MEYKTLRYPGHAQIMSAIRGLGLLGLDPVDVHGEEVVPRDLFIACADPRLRRPGGRDLVALRVEVGGERSGRPVHVVYDLIDYYDEAAGVSAMERTTGYSLSITGQLQATGHVFGPGVGTPDRMIPPDAYVDALAERGVDIHRREVHDP
jgi:lysine 6-dehydrogenase